MAIIPKPEDFRKLELNFAYEMASSLIESQCFLNGPPDDKEWLDLDHTDNSLDEVVAYLDSRRLILCHPENPLWIKILDEDEPLVKSGLPSAADLDAVAEEARIADATGKVVA